MTVTYNQQAWLKERTLIHVSGVQSGNRVRLEDVDGEVLTSPVFYTPTSDGKLVIDVTDIVRVYGILYEMLSELEFHITEINANGQRVGSVQFVEMLIAGDTNYNEWIIPTHPIKEWAENNIPIAIPRMILRPIMNINGLFPLLITGTVPPYSSVGGTILQSGWNNVHIPNSYIWLTIYGQAKYGQELVDITDCQKQAIVEWRDRLGMTKRAVWELRNVTENTADEQNIENISNAYDVRKGKEITAVLHLDGLTAYDVWYYSDIVTSSDVRVALKASEYDSSEDKIKDECKVEVTTKKAEIPDGDTGEFYSLDIEINYKRYDTV